MIAIKRIYVPAEPTDGFRVLVDRLWPRGVARADTHLNDWMKSISPSNELRKWFDHQDDRWDEFVKRYQVELQMPSRTKCLEELRRMSQAGTVTLLYSARNEHQNNAVVIRDLLQSNRGWSNSDRR